MPTNRQYALFFLYAIPVVGSSTSTLQHHFRRKSHSPRDPSEPDDAQTGQDETERASTFPKIKGSTNN